MLNDKKTRHQMLCRFVHINIVYTLNNHGNARRNFIIYIYIYMGLIGVSHHKETPEQFDAELARSTTKNYKIDFFCTNI